MKAQRIFRPNRKTPVERASERKLREKIQAEKPTLEELIQTGDCEAEAVMTMGMYFDVQKALQALKADRTRSGLTIAEVAECSGLDRAVVSRLENGKQDNPTIATLMRYASALGKRFLWTYEDLTPKLANGNGKAGRRRTRSQA